jgi:hypothetical protein
VSGSREDCIRHNRYLIACRWAAGFTARINKYNLLLSSISIASSHEYMRFFLHFQRRFASHEITVYRVPVPYCVYCISIIDQFCIFVFTIPIRRSKD